MSKKTKNFQKEESKFLQKSSSHHLPEKGLEHLQGEYQRLLPEKLNHLNQILDEVKSGANQNSLSRLMQEVHTMGESAKLYGYFQVCDLCNQFEAEIVQKLQEIPKLTQDQSWVAAFDKNFKKIKESFFGRAHG